MGLFSPSYYIRFDLTGVMCLHSILPRYHVVRSFVLLYFIAHIWQMCMVTVYYYGWTFRMEQGVSLIIGFGQHMSYSFITQRCSAFLYVPCVLT